MLKSISLVILSFSLLATAHAVANPLALFVEQCLLYQPDLTALDSDNTLTANQKATEFELQTLALNNINDRVQYYRPFATDTLSKQGLLWCQLHLADELYELLNAKTTKQLIDSLQTTPYQPLAEQLIHLQQSQWELTAKSKLHSAQAAVTQALAERQLTMQFNDEQCKITDPSGSNTQQEQPNIDIRIAKYLLVQPNEDCRKQAWFAYQTRAKSKIQSAISFIHELNQQQAQAQGYQNAAQLMLAPYDLSPAMLNMFLDSQTKQLTVAPWNMAQALSHTQKASAIKPISAHDYLLVLLSKLTEFGIIAQSIPPDRLEHHPPTQAGQTQVQIIRIMHQQRVLGEIYTYPQTQQPLPFKVNGQLIKQTVIGHQFGQYALSFPDQLTTQSQQLQLINELSHAIVSLAQSGQFYLLNRKTQNLQRHAVASLWLSHFLSQSEPFAPMSEREQLTQAYQTQMNVFRSKASLMFYQYSASLTHEDWLKADKDLSAAFEQSFGRPWPHATDAIYSYQAIANKGISLYLPLWHQAIAQLIMTQAPVAYSAQDIFDLLIVNESQLSFNNQLEQLIGPPIDPYSLIRRFNHAETPQE
jgi:hypothetical protein